MPNHKSAEKRLRQSEQRRVRNRIVRGSVRTAVKKTLAAVAEQNPVQAKENFQVAEKAIASAAAKGVYPRRTAARKVSRLAQAVNKVQPTA